MSSPTTSEKGKIWLVSRHPGAIAWMTEQHIAFDEHVKHLDVQRIQPGDTVIGSLPIHLAAQVCARGASYLNLSIELPFELRGRELSSQTLTHHQARLEAFHISPATSPFQQKS